MNPKQEKIFELYELANTMDKDELVCSLVSLQTKVQSLEHQFDEKQDYIEHLEKVDRSKEDDLRYWRCLMGIVCGKNHDNPDKDFVEMWAVEEGLNKEDTEDLLINFGHEEDEEEEE